MMSALVTRYPHRWEGRGDVSVAVIAKNQGKHKDNCLCYQRCRFFKPGAPDNCGIAQALYEFDVRNDIVTPVWECAMYRSMDEPMEDEGGISNV